MVLCLIGADRYFSVQLGHKPSKASLLLLRFYMGYGSEFDSLALTTVQQNIFLECIFVVSYQPALCGFTALLMSLCFFGCTKANNHHTHQQTTQLSSVLVL